MTNNEDMSFEMDGIHLSDSVLQEVAQESESEDDEYWRDDTMLERLVRFTSFPKLSREKARERIRKSECDGSALDMARQGLRSVMRSAITSTVRGTVGWGRDWKREVAEDVTDLLSSEYFRAGSETYFPREQTLATVLNRLRSDEPIQIILPGFPVKVHNPLRARGSLPDLAEEASLYHIRQLLNRIYHTTKILNPDIEPEFIIAYDGVPYESIFEEPPGAAKKYQRDLESSPVWPNEIDELAYKLSGERLSFGTISTVDIGELVDQEAERFHRALAAAKNDLLGKWEQSTYAEKREQLIASTMSLMYLGDYPEDELREVLIEGRETSLAKEMRERAERISIDYIAFKKALQETELLEDYAPNAIRATCHPKPGHVGLKMLTAGGYNYPWNGVGVFQRDGFVRVEPEHRVENNPQYMRILKTEAKWMESLKRGVGKPVADGTYCYVERLKRKNIDSGN